MIEVKNLKMHFGGIHAVDDVSLSLQTGRITGLIGPNGAGKTTLFNVIAGHYKPTSGHVYLDGEDITGLEPHQLFAKGMLRTFQIAHEFSTLSVRENLMMVPGNQSVERLIDAWLRPNLVKEEEARVRRRRRWKETKKTENEKKQEQVPSRLHDGKSRSHDHGVYKPV